MMLEIGSAYLLSIQPTLSSSAYLYFFTNTHGGISCFDPKCSQLEPFVPYWLSLCVRGEQFLLKDAQPWKGGRLFQPGVLLSSAFYLNELLKDFVLPGETDETVWMHYEQSLERLSQIHSGLDLEWLLRQFEWNAFKCAGLLPSMTHLLPDRLYQWNSEEGFEPAAEGVLGLDLRVFSEGQPIKASSLKALKTMMRERIKHFREGRPLLSRQYLKYNEGFE